MLLAFSTPPVLRPLVAVPHVNRRENEQPGLFALFATSLTFVPSAARE